GEIHGLKRIWANSKLLFDVDALDEPPGPPVPEVGMVVVSNVPEPQLVIPGWPGIIPDLVIGVQEGGPFSVIRFYQGTGTQQIDPTIESYEGVGNTPAYRHTAYVVIQDLQLADYGNALPNLE